MKRGLIIGGGIVVVLIVAVVAAVFLALGSLDKPIQEAVETYSPEITQAEVKLNEVEIDLAAGAGAVWRAAERKELWAGAHRLS